MHGNMWVESEVGRGSKFFFTLTSHRGYMSLGALRSKMSPFANRNILFLDTKYDQTRVAQRTESLGLNVHVVHDMSSVSDRESCPHIDTIVVDSPEWVSTFDVYFSSISVERCFVYRPRGFVNTNISDTSQLFSWRQ